jgi:predicted nucleotidyltransferase
MFPDPVKRALHYLKQQVNDCGTIVLFGSRARGTARKYADFDIGIYMKTPLSWRRFSVWKTQVEEIAWPYRIDLVDLGRAPSDFWDTIQDEMIVLHGEKHVREKIREKV